MNRHSLLLISLLFLCSYFTAPGQGLCPPNIDFEFGNTTNWNLFRGSVTTGPVYTLTGTGPIPGMHVIEAAGSGYDYFGGFPVTAPGGGNYSLKLGHDSVNRASERAIYYVAIPPGTASYSFVYHYAVVLENPIPPHAANAQPRLVVDAIDTTTGLPVPCVQYTYIASSTIPGFTNSPVTSTHAGNGLDVWYKPWTAGNMKFPGLNGDVVAIEFTASDCTEGGHFGYAYVDMSCGLFAASTYTCGSDSATVEAPFGYSSYQWYDSTTFSISYGTTATASIPIPSVATTYAVICTPYAGYGCTDTLYTNLVPTALVTTPSNDTTICAGSSISISSNATDIALPLTYSWAPPSVVAGLSCTTCATPVVTPLATTAYTVTTTDAGGCQHNDVINVTVVPNPGPIITSGNACIGSGTTVSDVTGGGVWGSLNTSIATVATTSGTSGTMGGVATGIATITYSFGGGLCSTSTVVTVNPQPPAISGPTSVCVGTLTSFTDGAGPGTWTSSNPAAATVGSATGNVYGVAPGNTTINYTAPSGCPRSLIVNVISLPAAIGGTRFLCQNLTTALTDAGGGTWTSSNTGVATVGSTGIVGGVTANTSTITYSLGVGCNATAVVTVNQAPLSITGVMIVCQGLSTTLSDLTTGGTWTSSSTLNATVGSTSGIVTGGAVSGTTTSIITYTAPGGCSATALVTINPSPSAISVGSTTGGVCVGSTINLTDASPGGTWLSSSPSVATVGSTGIMGGVAALGGSVIITYTLPTGCKTTAVVSVNTIPAPITGTTSLCEGGATGTLSDPTTGGTWLSSNTSVTINAFTGAISSGPAGTATINYTSFTTGCTISTVVTVNGTPPAILGDIIICPGVGSPMTDAITGGTWSSSSTAVATVGSHSGIVTGAAVTATSGALIIYTAPTGCSTDLSITVYTSPPPITGTMHFCGGQSVSLSEGSTGTWLSSNTFASVTPGPASSTIVTGNLPGLDTITFTSSTGCTRTAVVTVNATPGAIGGNPNVCVGSTTSLTDPGGGTWTSSNATVASAGLTTGVIGGVGVGTVVGATANTATITYSLGGSCTATVVVTVHALPAAITGTLSVCVGASTVLSDASTPGTWASSNTAVASVGSTGVVSAGIVAGTSVITFTTAAGCSKTTIVTVNPLPVSCTVTGGGAYCAGGTGVHIGLGCSSTGTTYHIFDGATLLSSLPGTGAPLVFGPETGAGTYTITATTAAGCTAPMAGSATVTVNPLPTAFTVTGGGGYCAGGTGVHIGLSGSAGNVTYQLFDGTTAGVSVHGTGASIDFGLLTTPGTYTVIGTDTLTACPKTMTGAVIVTINPIPSITGAAAVCIGATLPESAPGFSGGTWSSSLPAVATINSTSGAVTGGTSGSTTIITYTATTGCTATKIVSVSVSPVAITGPSSVCYGSTATETDTVTGGIWSITPPTSVATIGSISGIVTAGTIGTATITYSLGTSCTVTKVVTVTVAPAGIIGASALCRSFTTSLTDPTGGGTWSSSHPAVATVSSTGMVTADSTGTATIIYTLGGCAATLPVTVSVAPGPIIGTPLVCVGVTTIFSDTVGGGTWTTSNSLIASVSSAGDVRGVGVAGGTATISYSLGGTCVAQQVVTVSPVSTILGSTGICVGTTTVLGATPIGGTWLSGNTSIATVGSTGTVSGVAFGVAPITYTTLAGCISSTNVTVNTAPSLITGMLHICSGTCTTLLDSAGGGTWSTSSPATASVGASSGLVCGGTAGTAVITYSLGFGCTKNIVVTINALPSAIAGTTHVCVGSTTTLTNTVSGGVWSSSNTSVASLVTGGTVRGITPGTATITYAPSSGCAVTTTVTVNPLPGPVTGVTSICVGSTTLLSDTAAGGDWTSTNTFVATVNPISGLARGNNPGLTTITYTLPTGCSSSVILTVLPPPPAITGPPMVCSGQSVTLHDSASGGTWSTGPSYIATIDTTTGVFWGVSSGTVIVSYTVGSGCSVIGSIIVNPVSPISGDSVVCAGFAVTLTDTTEGGTWSTANTTIATAITTGLTTGIIGGVAGGATTVSTVAVIYTLPTGCSASEIVTVNPAPPPIGGVLSVCSGSTTTLSDATSGGAWSSGSPDTATVNAVTGVVNGGTVGVTGGVALITYTLAGTGCPAVAQVTVNPLPPAITGAGAVCIAATDSLTDGITGGVWASSFTSVATIDSVTGVVTGGTPGSTTITYILPTGCSITDIINVSAPPQPISGPVSVCPGDTILLTDGTGGGSWSSTSGMVTVEDAGNVIGVANGPAIISYTIGAGCSAIYLVTVLPEPDAIAGITTLCQGTGTTLSDGTPGGMWMSSDTTAAIVGLLTGVVNAPNPGTAGSATITYTAPTGCSVTRSLVINPSPLPISGFTSVCVNFTTALTDGSAGDVWSSTNTTVAMVDGSGTVTGVSGGTSMISYTLGSCAATVTVTVNTPPNPLITGTATVCIGSATTLGDTPGGGTWTSSDPTVAQVDLYSGIVTGVGTLGGIADITYSLGFGCTADIIVTVNPLPVTMTGTAQVCIGMSTELFDGTGGGAWSSTNTEVAAIVDPTAGVYTGISAGTSTISYTINTGCAATSVITVNPIPTAITGPSDICLGSSITLADGATGGTWSSSTPGVAAVVNPLSPVIHGATLGAATIVYTLPAGCTSDFVVNVVPLPVVFTLTGGGSYCNGGTGVDIGLNGSAVGVNYLLYNGVTATGTFAGTGSSLNFGLQSISGPYTVIAISTSTGCINTMAGSAAVTIMATTAPSVSITNTATDNTVCSGTSATFTAIPVYGGTLPTYQWNVDGVNVGTGATYTFVPADGDVVTVTLTSNGTCPSPATASNSVAMTVLPQELPVAGITVTPGETVCDGNAVTLTAAPLYGGSSPAYQWIKNSINTVTGPVYSFIPAQGDVVNVQMTSDYLCALATTVLGSPITMTVDTPELPLVTINAKPGTSVSIGAYDTLTAVVTNGGTSPSYQWLLNEIPVSGATTNTYISNNFQYPGQDSVTCVVTNNGICKAASFAWVYISVHPEGVTQVVSGNSDISIQPNPNKGEFTIKGTLGTATDEEVSLEITDMLGQVVYREKIMAYSGKINKQITLGKGIANGMYMLNMVSGTQNSVFHIVIEQ